MGRKNEADTGGGIKSNKTIRLKYNLKLIGVGTSLELTQKCELLGKARILRKILEIQGGEGGETTMKNQC